MAITNPFKRKPADAPQRAELNGRLSLHDKLTEVLSGMGGASDRVSNIKFTPPDPVANLEFEQAFEFDGIIERFVTRPVEDALAKGIEFTDLEPEEIDALNDLIESPRIDLWGKIEQAWVIMRMTRGAAIWIDTGAPDLSQPIAESERVQRLVVLDSETLNADIRNRYTDPEFWECGEAEVPGFRIHKSRLLIFPGRFVSYRYREQFNGWGARELDKIWEAWIHFKAAFLVPANVAITFEEAVVGLKGLNDKLTSPQGKALVRAKLFDLEAIRSFLRVRVQDTEDTYDRVTPTLTGLSDLMEQAKKYFVTVTGWPHTILLGESPGAGLDGAGAGKSQKEDWARYITAQQETYLRKNLVHFLNVIAPELRQGRAGGFQNLKFKFPSILQESEMERAQRMKLLSEVDGVYLTQSVLDIDEARDELVKREFYAIDPLDLPEPADGT